MRTGGVRRHAQMEAGEIEEGEPGFSPPPTPTLTHWKTSSLLMTLDPQEAKLF